jgi:hypothetical protein
MIEASLPLSLIGVTTHPHRDLRVLIRTPKSNSSAAQARPVLLDFAQNTISG